MLGYTADLSSRTQGRATCSMYFDRYEQVRGGPDDNVDRWLAGVRLEPGPKPLTSGVALPEPDGAEPEI